MCIFDAFVIKMNKFLNNLSGNLWLEMIWRSYKAIVMVLRWLVKDLPNYSRFML